MIEQIFDYIQPLGLIFAGIWVLTIVCSVLRPQRYINSFLLMLALLVSTLLTAGLLGPGAGTIFLMVCAGLVMLFLLIVPFLLIFNGIQMIRRESVCLAHLLSLGLGIVLEIGEIAALLYVLDLSNAIHLGKWSLFLLVLSATIFYFSFLLLCFILNSIFIQFMPHRMNFHYVVIHGCGLSNGLKLTKILASRVDKAIWIYEKCPEKPYLIPSGGQGSDEKVSEAQAMKDYMISRGIPEDHILPEDQSTSTKENLIHSKRIIDGRPGPRKTALVSSNFHIYRCLLLARKEGLKCTGIGADVALYFWPSAVIREFVAIFVNKGFFPWAILGYVLFMSPLLAAALR